MKKLALALIACQLLTGCNTRFCASYLIEFDNRTIEGKCSNCADDE